MFPGKNCSDPNEKSEETFQINKIVPRFIVNLEEGTIIEHNSLFLKLFNAYSSCPLGPDPNLSMLMGAENYARLKQSLKLDGSVASISFTVNDVFNPATLFITLQLVPDKGIAHGMCTDKTMTQAVRELEDVIVKRNEQLCRTNKKLQASLAEKEVMFKEIHHRVKNNLQIIHSILNLQSRYSNYPEILKVIKECQDRIKAMAFVHDSLCRSNDLSRVNMKVYINEIIMYLYQAYLAQDKDINIQTEISQVELDLHRSITCGIIFNELISNSLKHAFKESDSGWLKVAFEEQEGSYVLSVSDDGSGFAGGLSTDAPKTFGLRLIKLLTEQLDGEYSIESNNGLSVRITFPKDGGTAGGTA